VKHELRGVGCAPRDRPRGRAWASGSCWWSLARRSKRGMLRCIRQSQPSCPLARRCQARWRAPFPRAASTSQARFRSGPPSWRTAHATAARASRAADRRHRAEPHKRKPTELLVTAAGPRKRRAAAREARAVVALAVRHEGGPDRKRAWLAPAALGHGALSAPGFGAAVESSAGFEARGSDPMAFSSNTKEVC